jgi:hypothetical protein
VLAYSGTPAANKLGYGVMCQGITSIGDNHFYAYNGTAVTLTNSPAMTVKNCNIWGYNGFSAGSTSYMTEDYNIAMVNPYATNVTVGTHSVGSTAGTQVYAPLFHFGQEQFSGGRLRPPGSPQAGSGYLNFGDGTAPAYDLTGKNRPEGS